MKQSKPTLLRALTLLSFAAAASAILAERRRRRRIAKHIEAQTIVRKCGENRIVLAIDIGSSSVRCSAYTAAGVDGGGRCLRPVLVSGCAVKIKHTVVCNDGTADAEEVVELVDRAVDQCFRCPSWYPPGCLHVYAGTPHARMTVWVASGGTGGISCREL